MYHWRRFLQLQIAEVSGADFWPKRAILGCVRQTSQRPSASTHFRQDTANWLAFGKYKHRPTLDALYTGLWINS